MERHREDYCTILEIPCAFHRRGGRLFAAFSLIIIPSGGIADPPDLNGPIAYYVKAEKINFTPC
jgi:hypothetical protein